VIRAAGDGLRQRAANAGKARTERVNRRQRPGKFLRRRLASPSGNADCGHSEAERNAEAADHPSGQRVIPTEPAGDIRVGQPPSRAKRIHPAECGTLNARQDRCTALAADRPQPSPNSGLDEGHYDQGTDQRLHNG
jgi:hypothetical protein